MFQSPLTQISVVALRAKGEAVVIFSAPHPPVTPSPSPNHGLPSANPYNGDPTQNHQHLL